MIVVMLVLLISAMTIGKLTTQIVISEPPPQYLPGNPLPIFSQYGPCFPAKYDYQVPCSLDMAGKPLVLTFQSGDREIVHTSLWSYEYRVGDMLVAWGNPTGVIQHGKLAYLYWGKRAVFIYGTTLNPNSHVKVIEYFTNAQHATDWHGFTSKVH